MITVLVHCQSPVGFTEPQPLDEPQLSVIPTEYRGIYWCATDSITLIIDDQIIYKQKKYDTKISKSQLESNSDLTFKNNMLYAKELSESYPAVQIGDTIFVQITLKDTLFSDYSGAVLKYFKNRLILNKPLNNDLWDVTIISLKKQNTLSLTKATIPSNLEEIEQITPIQKYNAYNDETPVQIIIAPTKAEFEQILNKGVLFRDSCLELKRMLPIPEVPL